MDLPGNDKADTLTWADSWKVRQHKSLVVGCVRSYHILDKR